MTTEEAVKILEDFSVKYFECQECGFGQNNEDAALRVLLDERAFVKSACRTYEELEAENERLKADHHHHDRGRTVRTGDEIRSNINSDHPCCIPVGDAVALLGEKDDLLAACNRLKARGIEDMQYEIGDLRDLCERLIDGLDEHWVTTDEGKAVLAEAREKLYGTQ